jgi:hypothetical protein
MPTSNGRDSLTSPESLSQLLNAQSSNAMNLTGSTTAWQESVSTGAVWHGYRLLTQVFCCHPTGPLAAEGRLLNPTSPCDTPHDSVP